MHQVQARAAGEEGFLCFLPRRVPTGGVLTGELPQRRWRPIEVGKSIARPWRVRWWGQGGDQSFLGLWPTMWHAMVLPHHSQGPPLGFIHSSAHTAWLIVDSCSRSMDRWLGLQWTESTLLPSGLVYVH